VVRKKASGIYAPSSVQAMIDFRARLGAVGELLAMQNILLMTSAILPAAEAPDLVRKDPALRLADYKKSLRFQIELLNSNVLDAIVYVDNTGFPLNELKNICEAAGVSQRVEFISYTTEISPRLSRYFLEVNLIGEAIRKSRFIQAASQPAVWKLTGRYIVTNIKKIIRRAPECDLYINCRNYPDPWADFYLIAFTLRGYSEIVAHELRMYENNLPGEAILRKVIETNSFGDCKIVKRFNCTPRVVGIRGYDGVDYSGWKHSVKFGFRRLANEVAPQIWI